MCRGPTGWPPCPSASGRPPTRSGGPASQPAGGEVVAAGAGEGVARSRLGGPGCRLHRSEGAGAGGRRHRRAVAVAGGGGWRCRGGRGTGHRGRGAASGGEGPAGRADDLRGPGGRGLWYLDGRQRGQRGEALDKLGGPRRSGGRILGQQRVDDRGQGVGDAVAADVGRRVGQDPVDDGMDGLVVLLHERHRAVDGGQEAHPDAVQVAGHRGPLAAQDLRGGVGDAGGDGGRGGVGSVVEAGDAEVPQDGLTAVDRMRMFSGFRSRWSTPEEWASARAAAIWDPMARSSALGDRGPS